MSQRVESGSHTARGIGAAVAGVAFCDFIGLFFLAVPAIGAVLAFTCMFGVGPSVAWLTLEGRPNRSVIAALIGVGNALFLFAAAISLMFLALSAGGWG